MCSSDLTSNETRTEALLLTILCLEEDRASFSISKNFDYCVFLNSDHKSGAKLFSKKTEKDRGIALLLPCIVQISLDPLKHSRLTGHSW